MTNGSRVRKLFFKNQRSHQRKRSKFVSQWNSQLMNALRMVNQWRCRMNSIRSSAMFDVFTVLFILYRTSDLFAKVILVRTNFACFLYL